MIDSLRQVVLALARARTPEDLAQCLAMGIARERTVALARVWVREPGEILRLRGSAGTPSGGGSYNRLDGEFSCIQVGDGKIGAIAATGEARIVCGLRGDEEWLTNSNWIARQAVRAFVGYPLRIEARCIGVLAIFDRSVPSDAALDELRFIADLATIRLDAVRATSIAASGAAVVTRAELREIERRSIQAALARTGGRVFGASGAAALLGMKPTTLASRITALGLSR